MSHRPLVFVSGLTLGDYLLWNWSLSGNHDLLALVSGLTMPPLAIALMWLTMVSLARLVARLSRRLRVPARPGAYAGRGRADTAHRPGTNADHANWPRTDAERADRPGTDIDLPGEIPASATASPHPPSDKLAA